jgi:hypothetical protein
MSCAIFFPPRGTVLTTTHVCMLLGEFSRELHPVGYSWDISTKLSRAYYTESQGLQSRVCNTKFWRLHHEIGTLHHGGFGHDFWVYRVSDVTMVVS